RPGSVPGPRVLRHGPEAMHDGRNRRANYASAPPARANPSVPAMLERAYPQRLEADLARWQADGVITPAAGIAIRHSLPPVGAGLNIAVVVGIVGGLLIAAAFLALVAANWTEIARPVRFAILLAGIAGAYGVGA